MKIKNLTYLLIILLVSCTSSEKLVRKGNYDAAINKAVKKIMKNPNSTDDIEMLDKAYKLANGRDQERVKYLRLEGNPNTWDEVFMLYSNLKNRQSMVQKVLPMNLNGRTITYDYIDYDREIVEAKGKAADYYYAHGQQLMNEGTKEGYRQAYYDFVKASEYKGGSYQNINSLIEEARLKGISRALIDVVNKTPIRLTEDFIDNILTINTDQLNNDWVEFHLKHVNDAIEYDYYIDVVLNIIDVSPEIVEQKETLRKKTVENGFDYAIDARGNVMKDTSGNDIKIIKYKDLQCTLIEKHQKKSARIEGEVDIYSENPRRLLKKEPIGASSNFEHVSGKAIGDLEALKPEDKQIIEIEAVPFPDDFMLVQECSEALRGAIAGAIRQNRIHIK
ncbi:MAG: hypothetical protein JXJ22_07150 [Bacteroidales bacterium]|nr:hypothetical protein [Bacteroidales bacterium]